jgi:ring-1,2-phenylacetyl-CoA epoxidase subunit PaaE
MQNYTDAIINYLVENLSKIPGNIASSIGLLGLIYIIVWVLFAKQFAKKKVQLVKRAGRSQIQDEIINIIWVVVANVFFASIIFWLKDNGYTQFYDDTFRYGIWYEVFAVLALLFINDTWFYWAHRTMHHPKIYKYIHAEHHKSLDTTPFTSNSFHVIESILLTVIFVPAVIIMPVSLAALGIVQALGMFNNIKSHLGYEFYPKFFADIPGLNMLVTSTNHNLHHTRYNGNYGLMIRFWDIVCGTEIKETQDIFRAIHDRKKATIIDNTQYKKVQIVNIIKETEDTTSIYFKPSASVRYDYLAGQYINIHLKIGGKRYDRIFSLSSSPTDEYLRITAKLNGEVTHYFRNKAEIGDEFEALLPVGDFGIQPDKESRKNYLMIAGGSGITPLFSMINTLLFEEQYSKITLLYANKSVESTIFNSELKNLEAKYGNRLRVEHFISGKKRISQKDLEAYTATSENYEIYICGPDTLKKSVKQYLKQLQVKEHKVHTEDFVDGYIPWFGLVK